MRRTTAGLASLALAATFGLTYASSVVASPSAGTTAGASAEKQVSDDLPNPQEEKRRELRERGWSMVLNGEAKAEKRGASTVVKVGEKGRTKNSRERLNAKGKVDQYVELAREKTDKIFVVLAEFGNERHPSYPDQDTDPNTPGPATFDGPLRNAIPEPDRSVDNSTVWRPDFSQAYYDDLYFGNGNLSGVETVKKYFEKQSSGRYSVQGEVTDWVKVQFNEARYGRSNGFPCTGTVCSNTWVPDPRRDQPVGCQPARRGPDRRADQGRPGLVRRVGSQRLRRRRQLQRAGRVPRPLPDRPLRRRPGRR